MTDPTRATAQIDAALAALPADHRSALQALRHAIAGAAPEAEEAISYGMPAFRYHGRALVSYVAFKAHCSFFPMSSSLIEAHRDELAGYATAKGTLRFTPEHPLPVDLVERIVRERIVQIDAHRAAARGHERGDSQIAPLPGSIADIVVPRDDASDATWRWAHRSLPAYLLSHSVRAYCWGVAIAASEGWTFDRQILWIASLMHDVGLTTIPRNSRCFEVESARTARRFLEAVGLGSAAVERVAAAIILHMRSGVTLDDGVESVLLDRATGLDVRGAGYELVGDIRSAVTAAFPRGAFDRHFLRAIEREAAVRPTCQSARLLRETDLAGWVAGSPWRVSNPPDPSAIVMRRRGNPARRA